VFFHGRNSLISIRKEEKALPADKTPAKKRQERASASLSLKAGLTVETACILPFFLWAVLGAFYLIEISLAEIKLVGAVRDTARQMALLSYAFYNGEESGAVGEIVEGVLSTAYAKSEILKKAELDETALGEHIQVTLIGSDFGEEVIDLRVTSSIRIPVPIYHIRKLRFMERGRVRAWTGRSPVRKEIAEQETETEEMVYVTASGSVYHTDSNCTHIRISTQTAEVQSMIHRRNESGEKYYPCSCYQEHAAGVVYYTKYGNRYHSSKSCSSLKRSVRKVALSSLEGMRPCSKCG